MAKLLIMRDELGESVEYFLNDKLIAYVDHDQDGYYGMEQMEDALMAIANQLGWLVEVKDVSGEDGEE